MPSSNSGNVKVERSKILEEVSRLAAELEPDPAWFRTRDFSTSFHVLTGQSGYKKAQTALERLEIAGHVRRHVIGRLVYWEMVPRGAGVKKNGKTRRSAKK